MDVVWVQKAIDVAPLGGFELSIVISLGVVLCIVVGWLGLRHTDVLVTAAWLDSGLIERVEVRRLIAQVDHRVSLRVATQAFDF